MLDISIQMGLCPAVWEPRVRSTISVIYPRCRHLWIWTNYPGQLPGSGYSRIWRNYDPDARDFLTIKIASYIPLPGMWTRRKPSGTSQAHPRSGD